MAEFWFPGAVRNTPFLKLDRTTPHPLREKDGRLPQPRTAERTVPALMRLSRVAPSSVCVLFLLFLIIYKIFRLFFIFSYECVHSFVTFVEYDYNKLKGTRNCVSQAYGCGSVAQLYDKKSEGPVLAGPSAIFTD